MDERFSAFFDGEASPKESRAVLKALAADAGLRRSLSRQQWLRDTLRESDSGLAYDPAFADRVSAAIAQENSDSQRKVINMPTRRLWRSAAGLAAAASLAAVVVMVTNPLEQSEPDTQMANSTLVPAESQSVRDMALAPESQRAADQWAVSDPALEDQLNGYLLEHNGLARGYGLSRATPSFLRVATYGQRVE